LILVTALLTGFLPSLCVYRKSASSLALFVAYLFAAGILYSAQNYLKFSNIFAYLYLIMSLFAFCTLFVKRQKPHDSE
jgi:hypothetical protein